MLRIIQQTPIQRRTSGFAASMHQFLESVGLVSAWERFPIDFTHLHTDDKSSSVLDNFYMNERLLQNVSSAGPLHLGDNLSRHSPIMLSLVIPEVPSSCTEGENVVRRPQPLAWDRASQEQIQEYQAKLQAGLEELEVPDCISCINTKCMKANHSTARDNFVVDLMSKVLEAGYTSIPTTPAPRKVSETSKCHAQLPGWNENVKPRKEDSKFWYAIWLSAGRPSTGALHSVMVNAKMKYRQAVRSAQREANSAKASTLLAAAESGDRALLAKMKRVMGSRKTAQEMPSCLEGSVGETEILEKFKELYEELYNSSSTEGEVSELLKGLQSRIDCRSEGEVAKMTLSVVKRACSKIKPGRMDVSQSHSSDVFRHGPDLLYQYLADIFKSFLVHGTLPLAILVCIYAIAEAPEEPCKV